MVATHRVDTKDYSVVPIKRHPSSERFHEILRELGELHDRKQADYGTDNDPFANIRASAEFGIRPVLGAILRANDKVNRIKIWILKGALKNESIEDSLRDNAVYNIIALVLLEQEQTLEDARAVAQSQAKDAVGGPVPRPHY